MDPTLAQILNHLYDIEQENKAFREFIEKNAGVLKQANADMPSVDPQPPEQPSS